MDLKEIGEKLNKAILEAGRLKERIRRKLTERESNNLNAKNLQLLKRKEMYEQYNRLLAEHQYKENSRQAFSEYKLRLNMIEQNLTEDFVSLIDILRFLKQDLSASIKSGQVLDQEFIDFINFQLDRVEESLQTIESKYENDHDSENGEQKPSNVIGVDFRNRIRLR